MLKFDCFFTTDVGKCRKNNEDNFYLNGNYKRVLENIKYEKKDFLYNSGLFAVCDGMGGEEFGEKAALCAVETLKEYQSQDFNNCADEYINKANEKVCKMIEENNGVRSGSTLALVYISDNQAVCYNVGDSRVYLLRNKTLTQISQDHTQGAQMVRMGVLTSEQALKHKSRHILTQHLGIFQSELAIKAYISEKIQVLNDDIILLCSDGLTDMLSDKDIYNILYENKKSAKECANALKEKAILNGGKDNITVGIIKAVDRKPSFFKAFWRMF